MDEMASEVHFSEEKAQKAMIDAARLADELRAEQEIAMMLERDRKLLEAQVGDSVANFELEIGLGCRKKILALASCKLFSGTLKLSVPMNGKLFDKFFC